MHMYMYMITIKQLHVYVHVIKLINYLNIILFTSNSLSSNMLIHSIGTTSSNPSINDFVWSFTPLENLH